MHAAFASLRAIISLLGLAAAACGASQRGTPIGMSHGGPDADGASVLPPTAAGTGTAAAAGTATAATPRVVWPDFAAARTWPEAGPPTVALVHRRDGSLVHVRVEPSALGAYQALSVGSPMPDGARVVAWHESPSGGLLDGYLLEKRAGRWSAQVIDAKGALVRGELPACLRCHEMAPTDHLFGRPWPRPAPAPAPAPAPRESNDSARR